MEPRTSWIGELAVLTRLVSRPELNGCLVRRAIPPPGEAASLTAKGRVRVVIEARGEEAGEGAIALSVKPANLSTTFGAEAEAVRAAGRGKELERLSFAPLHSRASAQARVATGGDSRGCRLTNQACAAALGNQLFVFGGLEPLDVESDEDESDFISERSSELWSYCTLSREWSLRWAKRRGRGRFAVGPEACADDAALLPWRAGGEELLLLYDPNAAANYQPDPDGDIGPFWPRIPLDTRDMPWIYVVRTGMWQRIRTCGPVNAHNVPTGGEAARGPSGFFAGEQLPAPDPHAHPDDSDEEPEAGKRARHCSGAVALLPAAGAAPARLFVWGGVYWGPGDGQPDEARTALFQLTFEGDAAAFAHNPDAFLSTEASGQQSVLADAGFREDWFDCATGLPTPQAAAAAGRTELTGSWCRLRQTGEFPRVRHNHTMTALGSNHLLLLGGDTTATGGDDPDRGYDSLPSAPSPQVFAMRSFCLATGEWALVAGAAEQIGPTSNHLAFALPPSAAARWCARSLLRQFATFSMACNRMASAGGLHVNSAIRRHVMAMLTGERWGLRMAGRLLVVRRYDDIYRHEEDPQDTAVMCYDFFDAAWRTLATANRDVDWHDRGDPLIGGRAAGVPFAMEGWPNAGVTETAHERYGWLEQRLLLHGKVEDRQRGAAVFLSTPIPD